MDTGEIVKDEKVQQYTTFGLEKTLMTKTDIGIIKEKSNANSKKSSLILLGFKDHGAIPLHHTLDKSYFAYPNDEMISGSLAAFSALHSSMVRKKVIGLGELLTKKNATSRLVAIIPQEEVREHYSVEADDSVARTEQVVPPGFLVIPLPFEDDIRKPPEVHDLCNASNDLIEVMKCIIRKLQIEDFELRYNSYDNPALAKFWNYIEAIALNTTYKEAEDTLVMNVKEMENLVGAEIKKLLDLLPTDEVDAPKSNKRKVSQIMAIDDSGIPWKALHDEGMIHECTVQQLKTYLRSVGEKISGKKVELVERVEQQINGALSIKEEDTNPNSLKKEEANL